MPSASRSTAGFTSSAGRFADAARSGTTKAVDQKEGAMALLEKDATRNGT